MKKLKIMFMALFMAFTLLLSGCVVNVAVPTVKEGRFDFSITYEVRGEEKTYEGTYICKLDDVYVSCIGKGRNWTGYMEDGSEMEIIIDTNEYGEVYIWPGFYPEYFMSDPDYVWDSVPAPTLYMLYNDDTPDDMFVDEESDFLEIYGVRIISYQYAAPIENEYKEKWTFGRFELRIN